MEIVKFFENKSLCTFRNNELNEYRKIGKFTDLTLKSTDGKTMTVHKNILSASCPYFKGLFNSDSVETRQDEIQLVDDVTIADLEILVEYFYTGKARVAAENAQNLFIKAQYFHLPELMNFCSEFLIENIKIESCLDYWRNSVKYLNYNLTVECLKFIKLNCKTFLGSNVMNLTVEEFKLIMSSKEILETNQEDLYKFVVIWVKSDFTSRTLHLMELINSLDFTKISDEFIEIEIMTDEILQSNREFLAKMVSITFQRLRNIKKEVNLKSEEKLNCLNDKSLKKNIYLITTRGIYKLNLNESKWTTKFRFENKKPTSFATAAFKENIFISGGQSDVYSDECPNFEFLNTFLSVKIHKLPQMIESRCKHKLIDFKGKIYSCGGAINKGSIEIFDFQSLKWIKGPSMNENKLLFGLVASDDALYAFGGFKDNFVRSNITKQFDPREGKWSIISRDTPNTTYAEILSNTNVYCFDKIFGGNIFDLRTNTWTDSLAGVFDEEEEFEYYVKSNNIVEFNNEIFGVFQTDNIKTWGTYKFDQNDNNWYNLNISLILDTYDDIKLCVINEP